MARIGIQVGEAPGTMCHESPDRLTPAPPAPAAATPHCEHTRGHPSPWGHPSPASPRGRVLGRQPSLHGWAGCFPPLLPVLRSWAKIQWQKARFNAGAIPGRMASHFQGTALTPNAPPAPCTPSRPEDPDLLDRH